MIILSHGFKNPEDGDRGSVWFPALNFDIVQLNSHDHDGTDSALINSANIQKGSAAVLTGGWIANGLGSYQQTVSVPAGFNMTDYSLTTYLTSAGHIIYPTIEKVSSSTFKIYTLDNTLGYTVVFR